MSHVRARTHFAPLTRAVPPPRTAAIRYGGAVASILLMTLLRWLLDPILSSKVPFITLFLAVMFSAWYGGLGPTLVAIVLGAALADYFFVVPIHSFVIEQPDDVLALAVFVLVGLCMALLGEAQRKAAEAVRASERLLATTLRSIGDAVIATDAEGRITFLNPAAEALTGWAVQEALGRASSEVFRIVHEATRQAVASPVEHVRREGLVVGLANHTVLIAKDGTERPIDDSGAPIQDKNGKLLGVVLVFRDITARRNAERALQESEERYRTLIEQAADGIFVSDARGNTINVNTRGCALVGYAREELLRMSLTDLLDREDWPRLPQAMKVVRAGGTDLREWRFRRKDGSLVPIEVSVKRLADGRIQGIVRDITERKRAEEELKKRQAEIEALNARLRRAMTETHHRVKNNLQVIAAMVDMQSMTDDETVSVAELNRLGTQIRTLAAVHDLLTQGTKATGEVTALSAKETLEKLLPMLQATATPRRIVSHIEEARLSARQATALALVINELIGNALKHGRGDIEVRMTTQAHAIELEVSDDGPGFPPDFDPAQSANTGLELVDTLTRWDMAGQVSFGNRPQGGACVRVTLPLPTEAVVQSPNIASAL